MLICYFYFVDVHFPLEVQLVHYNAKYDSMNEAIGHEDGIAILVTFFQVQILLHIYI